MEISSEKKLLPAIVVLRDSSKETAYKVKQILPGSEVHGLKERVTGADIEFCDLSKHLEKLFFAKMPIIALFATGIVIRCLAPFISSKQHESPVIVLSEGGAHVIPLLGGHHGANRLAKLDASGVGGIAIISTASDSKLGFSFDSLPEGWRLESPLKVKKVTAALLAGEAVCLNDPKGLANWLTSTPLNFSDRGCLKIGVSEHIGSREDIILHPQTLAIGIGCERNTSYEEIKALVLRTLRESRFSPLSVACIASIDIKIDELGLKKMSKDWGDSYLPLRVFDAEALEKQTPRLATPSEEVFRVTGCHGVAEAAALACVGETGQLVVSKKKSKRATCAIAQSDKIIIPNKIGRGLGKLTIIGIGPGAKNWCTPAAREAVVAASDLVGYRAYLDLVVSLGVTSTEKARHDFELGQEEERVCKALDLAADGRDVALISSGDSGIFGMASLTFEILDRQAHERWRGVEINIEPGVSAMNAAAARAGAPLGHDFCAISLSDLMTPWSVIEKRLQAAATTDFVIAIYNPAAKKRRDGIIKAMKIISAERPSECPVVIAKNIGREGEVVDLTVIKEFDPNMVDMLTVILIGNKESRLIDTADGTRMYTPRGYSVIDQNNKKEKL